MKNLRNFLIFFCLFFLYMWFLKLVSDFISWLIDKIPLNKNKKITLNVIRILIIISCCIYVYYFYNSAIEYIKIQYQHNIFKDYRSFTMIFGVLPLITSFLLAIVEKETAEWIGIEVSIPAVALFISGTWPFMFKLWKLIEVGKIGINLQYLLQHFGNFFGSLLILLSVLIFISFIISLIFTAITFVFSFIPALFGIGNMIKGLKVSFKDSKVM